MTNRFNFLGINDDKSFCECCGRQGLKQVVWVEDTETGEIKHFGTTCANQPAKGFNIKKEIAAELRSIAWKKSEAARQAMGLYRASGGQMISGEDKHGPFSRAANMPHWDACFDAIWSRAA
jgi:hypothetical protein